MVTDAGRDQMKKTIALYVAILMVPILVLGLGKNKVQFRQFDWSIIQTEHFDIYFYSGEEFLAKRVALLAEAAYDYLSEDFDHDLSARIPIIVYKSHNEFQQTNVTLELIEEGVGGFTELFKNRVVIPFTGSYEELRHVVTHELTHVFTFDMMYGGLLESIFTRQYLFALPLWLLEGVTEFESQGWDSEAEMVMRDAAINGYYFALYQDVRGYLAYKEGQSVIRYIAGKYGREKIADLLQNINTTRDVDKAFLKAIGIDTEGLTKAWVEDLKKTYWPEIANRQDPEDIGPRLTDHKRDGSFINIMPAISPDGQKIVFLSDRSGYDDIYLMSALDGKIIKRLIKGGRSKDFESFHSLKSSFSWSPSGGEIAFVSKRKDKDVLYIIDSSSGKVKRRIELDFDSIYDPAFCPDGKSIAFVGVVGGRPGIYRYYLDEKETEEIHTGALEYGDISWSPDSRRIAFTANAPAYVESLRVFTSVDPIRKPRRDIYVVEVETGKLERITYCPSEDVSPVWSPDGKTILFVSDRTGTYNLYAYDFDDSTTTQLTDVLGGLFSPSWSHEADRLAFTCFNSAGWDVFQVKEPLKSLEPIASHKEREWRWEAPWLERLEIAGFDSLVSGFPRSADTGALRAVEGSKPKRYKVRFTPDWIAGSLQYSTAFGLGGLTRISVSDILGNHRIFIASDFFSSFSETDFLAIYQYLPRRIDYGIGLFHFKNYYYSDRTTMGAPIGEGKEETLFSERSYGGIAAISIPLDKYRRFDFDFTAMTIDREIYEEGTEYYVEPVVERREKETIFVPRLSYVKDTTIWGRMGPVGGTRYMLSVERSIVDVLGSDLSFTTGVIDYRKYLRLTPRTQIAARLVGATSQGCDPMIFYIGGGYTLRGYKDFEFEGNNILLGNFELRYPFIERLVTSGPIPISLGNLRGVFFFDIGAAWNGKLKDFRAAHVVDGEERLKHLRASYGFGIRMSLSYFVIKLDFAWPTDFAHTSKSRVHLTLGGEF